MKIPTIRIQAYRGWTEEDGSLLFGVRFFKSADTLPYKGLFIDFVLGDVLLTIRLINDRHAYLTHKKNVELKYKKWRERVFGK